MKAIIIIALLLAGSVSAQKINLATDKAEITFDLGDEVENGTVSGLTTKVKLDLDNLSGASIEASVEVKSIDTNEPSREEHVRFGEDYFDGNNHPLITFTSSKVVKTESGYMAYGKLTMKGITIDQNVPFAIVDNTLIARMKLHTGNFDIHEDAPESSDEYNAVVRIKVPLK